ncbi:hypothetical protein F5146DRAFT_1043449 [Armillaria mellea]|nr:hypothetical protein F5146DRAFT_1043449 [Armillaria mellea]
MPWSPPPRTTALVFARNSLTVVAASSVFALMPGENGEALMLESIYSIVSPKKICTWYSMVSCVFILFSFDPFLWTHHCGQDTQFGPGFLCDFLDTLSLPKLSSPLGLMCWSGNEELRSTSSRVSFGRTLDEDIWNTVYHGLALKRST